MTLLRRSAREFAALAAPDQHSEPSSLVEQLLAQMLARAGRRPGQSEVTSWARSLPAIAADLTDAGLLNVEVLVEYHFPLSSHRADVVLAGAHPTTGEASYVVIELKQWSSARRYEGDPQLVEVPGMTGGPKTHPVAQVRGYCQYLNDFLRTLQDHPDAVAGAAYLHNATDLGAVTDLQAYPMDLTGRLFTGADRAAFHAFLRQRLSAEVPGALYADQLLHSAVAPSKQLLKVAADEVRDREQFVLLGDQQLAVDLVKHEVERSRSQDGKRVVIVTGGPGSGKSVIALSLLGDLARNGRSVLHATGSKSFTSTLRKVAGVRSPGVKSLFKYFNQFMTADRNSLDVVILDEAHRMRLTSVDRYTRAELRTDRLQVDELIAAARVPVFLLDQHQVVRPGEMGSVDQIREHAARLGVEVHQIDLGSQFRCGGSEEYVRWVQGLLGLTRTNGGGVPPWKADPAFDVRLASSPEEMEAFLAGQLTEGCSARLTAGYCWSWSDPRPDGTLVDDVRIGAWVRPWNLKGDRRVGQAPPSHLWATEDGGFGQVGCVYTAQGFEYDWSGVIIGPDLVWRAGSLRVDRSANKDPELRSRTRVTDAQVDRLVRNVYKVLMTRGMRGTVLHAVDEATQEALRRLVPPLLSQSST